MAPNCGPLGRARARLPAFPTAPHTSYPPLAPPPLPVTQLEGTPPEEPAPPWPWPALSSRQSLGRGRHQNKPLEREKSTPTHCSERLLPVQECGLLRHDPLVGEAHLRARCEVSGRARGPTDCTSRRHRAGAAATRGTGARGVALRRPRTGGVRLRRQLGDRGSAARPSRGAGVRDSPATLCA